MDLVREQARAAEREWLEHVNIAGRQWRLPHEALREIADRLGSAMFEVDEPDLSAVAGWTAQGLTAYDAAFVAVAERRGVRLVTADREILQIAPEIARPLA